MNQTSEQFLNGKSDDVLNFTDAKSIINFCCWTSQEYNPALHGSPLCQQNSRNLSDNSHGLAVEYIHFFNVNQSLLQCILLQWKSSLILEAHSIILSNIIYNPTDTMKSLTTPWNVIAKLQRVIG